jgi:Icc-related predicted phosphoesterase
MKILAITDIHGHLETIDQLGSILSAPDLILLCGDLTHFGKTKEARQVIEKIMKFNQHVLAVPGNCDHPEVNSLLQDYQINLHGTGKILDGLGFIGLGGSLPCPGHTPNEFSEQQLTAFLEQGRTMLHDWNGPLMLLTHQPPINTINDRVADNWHVGSKAVRRFIEIHQPLICFTGHIHEGVGIDSLGQTRIINPGPLRQGGFAFAEINEGITTLEIRQY